MIIKIDNEYIDSFSHSQQAFEEFLADCKVATQLSIDIDETMINDASFDIFSAHLGQATQLKSIDLKLTASEPVDRILFQYFTALSAIPIALDEFKLVLNAHSFSQDFLTNQHNPFYMGVSDVLTQSIPFQRLKSLSIINDREAENSSDEWARMVGDFFSKFPNKSTLGWLRLALNELEALDGDSCQSEVVHAATIQGLIANIWECTSLTTISVTSNYLPDLVWNALGDFIKTHRFIDTITIDPTCATSKFSFVNTIFENQQLKNVDLTLIKMNDNLKESDLELIEESDLEVDEVDELHNIGHNIKHYCGLHRLKLDMRLGLYTKYCFEPLFLAVMQNPTLRYLDLTVPKGTMALKPFEGKTLSMPQVITELRKNTTLIEIKHTYHLHKNLPIRGVLDELTTRNALLVAGLIPFFNNMLQNYVNQYKPLIDHDLLLQHRNNLPQLIQAQKIFCAMISIPLQRLDKSAQDNQLLFTSKFYREMMIQFMKMIPADKPSSICDDLTGVISSYLNLKDLANVSSITGGLFFRAAKKALTIENAEVPAEKKSAFDFI